MGAEQSSSEDPNNTDGQPESDPVADAPISEEESTPPPPPRADPIQTQAAPHVTPQPQQHRESSSVPTHIGYVLDGGAIGDNQSPLKSEDKFDESEMKKCILGHYVIFFALVVTSIILTILSIYFELLAYIGDRDWNNVVVEKKPFGHGVGQLKGENYFTGRKLSECHAIFPPSLNNSYIKSHLQRNQALETTFICFLLIFVIGASLHVTACLILPKFRRFLDNLYPCYGLLGVLLFGGGILLTISSLVVIPNGYVRIRKDLEENLGVEERHRGKEYMQSSCNVNATVNQNELSLLLSVVKMCAYRYVKMNFRDPCKNISIPSHVLIPNDIQSPMRRRYDVENLQTLGICPKDDKKMAAIGLVSITAILCWIIMDIGSRVMKMHLMDEAQRGIRQSLLKYEPDPVNAITDLSSRKESDIPRAELRPLSFSPVVWDRIKDFAKLHRKSVRDSAGFPCAAICNPLTSDNTFTPIGGKFGSITSTSFQRPTGYGTQIKNSIMILAPKMVIRPPAVDEKEGRNSLWFNRTD